jgi:two-component sensor histidine kinase
MLRQLSVPLAGGDLAAASLVLTELVTNSIRHGCTSAEDQIDVFLQRSHGKLRIEVTQTGPLYDPDDIRSRLPGETRGWGVLLMDRMSSDWGVDPDRKLVWAELATEDELS